MCLSAKIKKSLNDITPQQTARYLFGIIHHFIEASFEEFGPKRLKTAYMNALIAVGKAVAIKGGRGAGKAEKVKLIGVGKKGSIIIPAEKVAELGIGTDEKFTVRKTKAGIALKKVGE